MAKFAQLLNKKKILLFGWLCLLLGPVTANAADLRIGSDRVSIKAPKGYCLMRYSEPSDRRLINYLEETNKGTNKVLMAFADCGQLKSWRIGKVPNLDDYGYVLAPEVLAHKKLSMDTGSYLSKIRKIFKRKGAKFFNRNIEKVVGHIERHFPAVKLNDTKKLGIISQDTNAIYWGLLQHLQTAEGKSKHMAGIMAMSLAKGKSVNFYLWKKYQGDRTVHDLVELTSLWVSRNVGAN